MRWTAPALACCCVPTLALAQTAKAPPACGDSAGFIRLEGRDTLVIEATHWAEARLIGDMYMARERTRARYTADLTRYPVETRFTIELWTAGDTRNVAPAQRGTLVLTADSGVFVVQRDSAVQVQRDRAPRRALPGFPLATGLEELILRQARASRRSVADIPVFFVATEGWAPTARVRFFARDSATLQLDQSRFRLRVDNSGRLFGGQSESTAGTEPSVRVTRVSCTTVADLLAGR